jgi:hypothetical protein
MPKELTDRDVREFLERFAAEINPAAVEPSGVRKRSRRRIAINGALLAIVVSLIAAAAPFGARAMSGPPTDAFAPPAPSSSQTVSGQAPCTVSQLRASGSMQRAGASRTAIIELTSDDTCTLQGRPSITLWNQSLGPISGIQSRSVPPAWKLKGMSAPPGWPVVEIAPDAVASLRMRWTNWCRPDPIWRLTLPDGDSLGIRWLSSASPPPCREPGRPSTLSVGPIEPVLAETSSTKPST